MVFISQTWLSPLAALLLSCGLCACDTRNIGTRAQPDTGPVITSFTVTPEDLAGLFGGEDATFKVEWEGGTAPYSISLDFGGSAEPNAAQEDVTSPFTVTRTMQNISAQSFTAIATVTDMNGFGKPMGLRFDVGRNSIEAPSIDSIVVDGSKVTVTASDPSGDDITVRLDSVTGGMTGSPASIFIHGYGEAEFVFAASDIFAGASGTATFTAETSYGGTDTDTSGTITVAPLVLPSDTLGAIPLVDSATVADTVKVVVATGATANPMQFMTGVSIVFPPGCGYSANSFDYGAPVAGDPGLNPVQDKDQETVDGIWTAIDAAAGFLGVGDNLLVQDTDLPAPFTGSSAIDFNITPLGGEDAPAGTRGILFNFNLEFSAPGEYTLGFLLFDEVNRTYYQDGSQAVYQWGDISNNNEHNTVTVTP